MKDTYSIGKRLLAMLLCVAMVAAYLPGIALNAKAAAAGDVVTDPGTAYTWENMMGTDTDGNRYAGRVWVDKSVYKEGDTAVLNTIDQSGASFQVELQDDEAFQVIFSALGSSMSTTTTTTTTSPLDVILVLDNSDSMRTNYVGSGSSRKTRMQSVIEAANSLLDELLAEGNDVRLGIAAYALNASTVLPFGTYSDGVELRVNNYTGSGTSSGVVSAYNDAGQRINGNYQSRGYEMNTNIQAGFDLGMEMLADAQNTQNRKPVMILLTDGAANTALDTLFDNDRSGTVRQVYHSSNTDPMIALGTLLGNAYSKANVEDRYGKAPMVYGIGVDLSSTDGSNAIINPKDNFNSSNSNSNIRTAYNYYTSTWLAGSAVNVRSGGYNFSFGHEYPQGSSVTDSDVAANINYVDTYYPVASADLEDVFDQIYQELSSGAFNPISSTTTVEGATGVENTPLIYVDFIGQYMEVKEIQSVTLFGTSYGVINNGDGTYTVDEAIGTNPATNESYNTSEDIRISITEENGQQKLEIRIDQEILPILLEQVDDKVINDQHSATITEIGQRPLRVYYTVGVDSDILLPNGDIDVTKIDSSYSNINGNEITFYSNRFGVMNPAAGGVVTNGDAHVGFKPSKANRYYYHQTNQDIFTAVSRKDGANINWQADEYGVRYQEDTFDFTWLTYENYSALQDGDEVYTYVTYYRPVAGNTAEAEKVTYLVYTNWGYLKESVAFYDHNAEAYINYDAGGSYTTGEVGYAIPVDKVSDTVDAYKQANPNAEIYGTLGVESLRTSRLHNMIVEKSSNSTETATNRYAPEYTYDTATVHNGNDVVVWLGNNGKYTTTIDTGIALTKKVTEAIGGADDTYALTVTVPNGVAAAPVVKDAHGNDVTSAISTYINNVLTVNIKADETVYISGIPAGTRCDIGENIPTNKDYYVHSKTATVTVPALAEVLNGADQFAPATVTNAPNKYGDLTVIKDIAHDLTDVPAAMADKVFTFKIQLPATLAGQEYLVDKTNASLFTGEKVTVGPDGSFTVELKNEESITVLRLPEGTEYTVKEIDLPDGYSISTDTVSDTIEADGDHNAHFVNAYGYTSVMPKVTVTGEKTVTSYGSVYSGNEEFVFELSRYVGVSATNQTGYDVVGTAKARAGERYTFELDTLPMPTLGIGEHYFRVTEQSGSATGMSYDSTRGMFRVVLTDTDADGVLEVAVENVANTQVSNNNERFVVEKDFNNIYDVDKTHADIKIRKILDNDTGVHIPLNSFHFTLVNKANANEVYNVTTDAAGEATIRIPELDEGEYEYELKEIGDAAWSGMFYDVDRPAGTDAHTVKVTVVKVGSELQSTVQIDGADTNAVTIRNEYKLEKISHTISGTKVLEGRDIADRDFTFALYETDSSFELPSNAAAKETVTNTGNGFSFSQLDYTQVGTYYYSVKEVDSGEIGFTYDTTHYHITVTVSVDGAKLKKAVSVNKIGHNSDTTGDIVFVNSYEAKPAEYAFQGIKVLHGRAPREGEFAFGLYEDQTLKETVTNKGDGSFGFAPVSFTAPGIYTFTIREAEPADNEKAPGVVYTGVDAPVTVTVQVVDENAQLKVASAIVKDKNGVEMSDGILFENSYIPAEAKVTFSGTKILEGAELTDNAFTFKLYETDHTFGIENLVGADAKNTGSSFGFGPITFTATGTYFYTLAEDASDPVENIVYDRTRYNYMVQVSDIGDGQLRAVITDMNSGVSSESAAAVSAEAVFTNATFAKAAEKEVYMADSTTSVDGEKVKPGDILTYCITYTNYTGEAVVADIMDVIPQYTAYVEGSASHGGTYAGSRLNWILNVAKGESVTVSFQVKVDEADGTIANTAVIRDGVNTYNTNEVVSEAETEKPPVTPPAEPPVTEPAAPSGTPQTGDNFSGMLFISLMILSSFGIAAVIVCKKKAEANEAVQ